VGASFKFARRDSREPVSVSHFVGGPGPGVRVGFSLLSPPVAESVGFESPLSLPFPSQFHW
jgi:hypothetical protein